MPDTFVIDRAAEMVLADGFEFGETIEGREVLDMARKYAEQQSGERAQIIPCNKTVGRKEDMSVRGRLLVFRQEDGDMCITVVDDEGNSGGVEFCTIGQGGGRSPNTLKALRALGLAIMADNEADPDRAAAR
jgi:hypothetical protein